MKKTMSILSIVAVVFITFYLIELKKSPIIFSTIAIPVSSSPFQDEWDEVQEPVSIDLNPSLKALFQKLKTMDDETKIVFVNLWVNENVVYRLESNYDSWANANDTLQALQGDCEDYAILKFQILKKLGIDVDRMFFIVGRYENQVAGHAILIVKYKEGYYSLDNNSPYAIESNKETYFIPKYGMNESRTWSHIR